MSKKYNKELEVAVNTAKKAGELIKEMSNKDIVVENKSIFDYVTNVDNKAEELIINELKKEFPEYDVLAEESGGIVEGGKLKWIVDPIDGTTNFMKNIPAYSVSIGLEAEGEIVVGVVYNIPMNEMFTAAKDGGAYLNDKKIIVSATDDIKKLVLGTGFPFKKNADYKSYLRLFEKFAQVTAGIRRPGSASIDLCWMACGRYDAFFEFGLSPWDVAAGVLIVKEAGGLVFDTKGQNDYLYGNTIITANNKKVSDFMLDYTNKYYYG